jgi:hypothetical protein
VLRGIDQSGARSERLCSGRQHMKSRQTRMLLPEVRDLASERGILGIGQR